MKKKTMNKYLCTIFIVLLFVIFAIFAVAYSRNTVSTVDADEMTSVLAEAYKDNPDAFADHDLIRNFDTGPYLYPKILHAFYDDLGRDDFKSISLFILIILNCGAVYFSLRYLGMSVPISLLVTFIAIFPRFSSGMDSVGVLTFKEAVGRSYAMPISWIAVAMVIKATVQKRETGPLFFVLGLVSFVHPVTIFLTAGTLLAYTSVVYLRLCNWKDIVKKIIYNLSLFLAGALPVVIQILSVSSNHVAIENYDSKQYMDAIYYRNMWDFFPHSAKWLIHVGIVSAIFIIVIATALYLIRKKDAWCNEKRIIYHAIIFSISAVVLSLAIPNIQAAFTEHFGFPFIFQQWSRAGKLFYVGLFIALSVSFKILYENYKYRFHKKVAYIYIACAITGALSSSFFFEITQFIVGYQNYERSYIPLQLVQHDAGLSDKEYKELCATLVQLGIGPHEKVISNDFNLRYYCRFDLFVTHEEGTAWIYKDAQSIIQWHKNIMLQDKVLAGGGVEELVGLMRHTGARVALVPSGSFISDSIEIVELNSFDAVLQRSDIY